MKTGVKRFNNSLSDKFLDMINDNFKKKLLKANLMRRKKRQQNEERKGDGPEDRVELSQVKWSAPFEEDPYLFEGIDAEETKEIIQLEPQDLIKE